MDDRLEQLVEMECADALLDGGVSVPLKRWSVPFKKRPLELRVIMKRPPASGSDAAGQGVSETGCGTRLETEGQGGGNGLCSQTWKRYQPDVGLYGMPGLRGPACRHRG